MAVASLGTGSSISELDDQSLIDAGSGESLVEGSEWGLCLAVPAGTAMCPAVCHELVSFQVGPYSAWWSPGSEDADAMGLVSPELPAPQCFASLLKQSWDGAVMTAPQGDIPQTEITGGAS